MSQYLPKTHFLAVTAISVLLGLMLLITPSEDHAAVEQTPALETANASEDLIHEIETSSSTLTAAQIDLQPDIVPQEPSGKEGLRQTHESLAAALPKETSVDAEELSHWYKVTVAKGDSLSTIFNKMGLSEQDTYQISRAAKRYKRANFKYIQPGQKMEFLIEDGKLSKLRHIRTATKGFEYSAKSNGFNIKPIKVSPASKSPTEDLAIAALQTSEDAGEPEPVDIAKATWNTIKVKRGDNLTTVFKRAGLSARDVYEIAQANKKHQYGDLKHLQPNQALAFYIDSGLKAMRHIKSPLESVEYVKAGKAYQVNERFIEPEIETRFVAATLQSSLFLASQKAGIPHNVIMEMAHVFGGVIDFIFDPRQGDTFSVLFEEKYLDGKKIGNGRVLAARFNNSGDTHVALRYVDRNGDAGYYSPEGVSMHKAFLRAPLDFTRISSNFNLRRLHPIHKRIKAHRGIDYAAPRGTPIFSAGDGRVIEAGYSRANGNYIFIRHGEKYVTKYLHLNSKSVKTGQRVKQRQVIGKVGSTGYATGPHLHYEFLIDGVHRNPRTILDKLPKAKSIADDEMARFKAETHQLLAKLEAHDRLLAFNDQSN